LRGKQHRIIFKQLDVANEEPTHFSATTLIEEAEVWARRWRLPAGATLETPDPAQGDGQFFIPLQGSVKYEGREYSRWSTIYVGPRDGRIAIQAGTDGADVLGMQFAPQPEL
jgi:redox-sensitive bicupin YhaK (pirin superfamily)